MVALSHLFWCIFLSIPFFLGICQDANLRKDGIFIIQIFKKLKTNKENKKAAEEISKSYRNKINDAALEALTTEDFKNLITVAKYADLGSTTVIQAAFCIGFTAGQTALKEKIKDGFLKGGDANAE